MDEAGTRSSYDLVAPRPRHFCLPGNHACAVLTWPFKAGTSGARNFRNRRWRSTTQGTRQQGSMFHLRIRDRHLVSAGRVSSTTPLPGLLCRSGQTALPIKHRLPAAFLPVSCQHRPLSFTQLTSSAYLHSCLQQWLTPTRGPPSLSWAIPDKDDVRYRAHFRKSVLALSRA